MITDKSFAKKRLMFIQKEDYNFLAYNLLVFLKTLGCTEETKKFRDFRKIAFLIEFISNGYDIQKYTQDELAQIYFKSHLKKQLLSHLLIILKNKKYIGISINKPNNSFDIWLNINNIPKDFFDKKIFSCEIENINGLKEYAHSLKTVNIKDLITTIFTNNNVLTWEI